jgi:Polysaccharide lyase
MSAMTGSTSRGRGPRAARWVTTAAGLTLAAMLALVTPATGAPAPDAAPPVGRPGPYPKVPVGPTEVFRGDYDTGNFGQWGTCQSVKLNTSCRSVKPGQHYSMGMVPAPNARQGPFAARFEVRDGDVPNFGGGERSEVSSSAPGALTHEGDERWYEFSMYLPPEFQNPKGYWFIVMQWHGGDGSPPLAVVVTKDGKVALGGGDGGDVTAREPKPLGPVRRGQWVDYVLHVGFSVNKSEGYVEGWENGVQTVPRYSRRTMRDDESYLKQGIYRESDGSTAVVWLDGLRITGPAGRWSLTAPRRPELCHDHTPPGAACTPPS